MSNSDGGPAFPCSGRIDASFAEGMSLRDWYAGIVLQGLDLKQSKDFLASWAYQIADAMIAERQKV